MNFQTIIQNAVKSQRAEEMKTSPQLTVGELILKLEMIDKKLPLYFDDLEHRPSGIESWRGSYDELAITYKGGGSINSDEIDEKNGDYTFYKEKDTTLPKNVKVKDLLKVLKMAIGKTMEGYKGGNFLIGKTTPVWVANYGETTGYKTNRDYDYQAVVDVKVKNKKAILETKLLKF